MLAAFRIATSLLLAGLGGWTTFQEPASLSGVITDTTGRALPGGRITVVSTNSDLRTAVTDRAGRYRIDGLRPGRYGIEASMGGFDTRTAAIEVLPGNNAIWSGALLVAPPIGEPSIERQVMHLTGTEALDCGRYAAPTSDAALQRSVDCAVTSAAAGRPFAAIVQFAGGSARGGEGLLGGSDGVVHLLRYGQGAASFRVTLCASPQVTHSRFTCEP
jgi:Carboxypeptidase regulatory-like domain